MPSEYAPRIIDKILESELKISGAVIVDGPRWCGKTRTSEEHCRSAFYIKGASQISMLKIAIASNPDFILQGDTPRLIDEWQNLPELWDLLKFEVDHRPEQGQFLLTGSSKPPEGSAVHSGAGRISTVSMRTMSLFESGESNGTVSLRGLFDGGSVGAVSDLTLDGIAYAIVRGGWPIAVLGDPESASKYVRRYIESIVKRDMSGILYGEIPDDDDSSEYDHEGKDKSGSKKRRLNAIKVTKRLIASIARNQGMTTPVTTLLKDVNAQGKIVSEPTLRKHIYALESLFILDNVEAWNPHLRSRTALVSTPKWYFTDPSIAADALGSSEFRMLNERESMGFLFESLCLRDIRVYSQVLEGEVKYIRTEDSFEVDFIVELHDGRWGAFEVKLGSDDFDKGAANLLKLRDSVIDRSRMGDPSFLAILTAMPIGYTRPDGVHIVPIGCLRD